MYKFRSSNLELLRIVSMLLVILIHYLPLRSVNMPDMLSNRPIDALFTLELHSIAVICTHCFILISGYFGIRWKIKSFGSLLFQLLFWAIAGYFVVKILVEPFYISDAPLTLGSYFSATMSWYRARWFVSAYICLYILSPILNSFIEKTTERRLLEYIVVFYIFSTLYGYFMLAREFEAGTSAISLIGLYLIGAWIRRSELWIVRWSKWHDLAAFFGCTVLLTTLSILLIKMGINKSIYGYLNPVVIIESVFLFQFFRKINIGQINWVNYLAAGAFAAYLFHYHPNVIGYCHVFWTYLDATYSYSMAYIIASFIVIFLVASLVDHIRIILWRLIVATVDRIQQITPPRTTH